MGDQITEVLSIEGDHSGAVSSLKATSREMQTTEKAASGLGERVAGVGAKVLGWLDKMASGAGKLGAVFTGGFALGAKGLGLLGSLSGLVTGKLLGMNRALSLNTSTLGAFVGHAARLAGMSDQADRLGRTWKTTLNHMSAPLVNAFAQAMDILNQTLQHPATQYFLGFITGIAAAILNSLLPALRAASAGVIAFLTALQGGDFAGAFGKGWNAAAAEINNKSKEGGVSAGATFMEGFNEGVKKTPPEQPKLQAIPGGFLKDIGDLGTRALNAFLAGFKKPDLAALNETGDAIKTRLETLYKDARLPALKIAPQLIIDQTAVARALSDAAKPGADLEAIIARVRGELSHLGPNVQDFVENQLRAVTATRALETATNAVTQATNNLTAAEATLLAKENELKGIQSELTEARRRQATEAEKLLPLSDRIRDIEQEIAQLVIDQADDRAKLVELGEQQEDVEREIARLEGEQAQKLKELAPLQQAVADATERHRQATLALRDAQDAMIPIQERLNQAREDMAAFTAEATRRENELKSALDDQEESQRQLQAQISERQRITQEGIANEQRALEDRIDQQEALLEKVDATHAADLNGYKTTIALVDEKYRKEIDGANKALAIANKALAAEESRNRVALLRFARQRQEAQSITDVNARIQALAKINRAEELYTASVKDRLDATRLEAQLQEDSLKVVQDRVAEEKGDVPERLAALEELIRLEKKPIEERLAAIREEGEERLKQLRRAAEDQKRSDDELLRAGAARVAQAKAAYDQEVASNNVAKQAIQDRIDASAREEKSQQQAIDRLARDEVVAARRVEAAQFELDTSERRITNEYKGTLATLRERSTALGIEREALDDRLGDERRGAETRLEEAQNEYGLRKSQLEELAEIENRPIERRLDAAQIEADAARDIVGQRQLELTAAEKLVTAAQKVVDGYQATADLAKARLDLENKNAQSLDDQRQLLGQIAAAQQANADALSNYQKALAEFNSSSGTKGMRPPGVEAGGFAPPSADFAAGMGAGQKWGEQFIAGVVKFFEENKLGDLLDKIDLEGAATRIKSGIEDYFNKHPIDWAKMFGVGPEGAALGEQWNLAEVGFAAAGALLGAKFGGAWGAAAGASVGAGVGGFIEKLGTALATGLASYNLGLYGPDSEVGQAIIEQMDANGAIVDHAAFAAGENIRKLDQGIKDFLTGSSFIPQQGNPPLQDMLEWGFLGPFKWLYDQLLGHSVIPDIVEGTLQWIGRLPGELLRLGTEAAINILTPFAEMAKNLPPEVQKALGLQGVLGEFDRLKAGMKGRTTEGTGTVTSLFETLRTNVAPKVVGLYNDTTGKFEALKRDTGEKVGNLWNDITRRFNTGKDDVVGTDGTWTKLNADISKKFLTTRQDLTDPNGQVNTLHTELGKGLASLKDTQLGASGPWVQFAAGITSKFGDAKKAITDNGGLLPALGSEVDSGLAGINTQTRRSGGPLAAIGEALAGTFLAAKNQVTGEGGTGGTLEALNKDSATALNKWPAAVKPAVEALIAAWKAIFGRADEGGALALLMVGGDKPEGNIEGGFFPWLEATIRSKMKYLAEEAWKSGFNETTNKVNEFVDKTMKPAWSSKFEELGKAIIAGIIAGINAAKKDLNTALATAIDEAKAAGDTAAGAHSPATKFISLGYNIGWGLAFGLSRAGTLVSDAMHALVEVASRAASLPNIGTFIDTLAARLPSGPYIPQLPPNWGSITLPTIHPVGLPGALATAGAAQQAGDTVHWHAGVVNFNNADAEHPTLKSLRMGFPF